MILEPSFWQTPLIEISGYLEKLQLNPSRISVSQYVLIEKRVFIGFYSARKLLEGFDRNGRIKSRMFKVKAYKAVREAQSSATCWVDWDAWLSESYNLKDFDLQECDIRWICNQFIHSNVFLPILMGSRLSGFYVASDHEFKNYCFEIDRQCVIEIFRMIGGADFYAG